MVTLNQPPAAEIRHSEDERKLPIRTYHCRFCSHLLIASTRELLSSSTPLRRRRRRGLATGSRVAGGGGGLDGALILEVPSSSKTTRARAHKKRRINDGNTEGDESNNDEPEEEKAGAVSAVPQAAPPSAGEARKTEQAHYTIPLSTLLPDPTPIIIRREDGFEKRVLLRCGRCRVVVGYNLHNTAGPTEEDIDIDVDEDDEMGLSKGGKSKEGVIYLLPGSIVGTEDLDVGLTEPDGGRGGDVLNAMIDRNPVLKGMEGEWMEWIK